MAEKKAITREMRRRYKKATKAEKAVTLDELTALTRWTRSYASRALRREPKKSRGPETRGRKRIYTSVVMIPLRKVWASLDYACGKAAGRSRHGRPLRRASELPCAVL